MQGHVFLNAGNTAQLTGIAAGMQDSARSFVRDLRLSAVRFSFGKCSVLVTTAWRGGVYK